MAFEIVGYNPDFIEQQVDLLWDETKNWKYSYATSYDSIKQQYSAENFDIVNVVWAHNNLLTWTCEKKRVVKKLL